MPDPTPSRPYMPSYGLLPGTDGKGLMSWQKAAERFSDCRNYWLCTVRPDGRPHAMPVWGIWLDSAFYFSTSVTSVKAENLASNPNCVITTDDAEEPVILEGTASEETDGAILARFVQVYKEKYDWDMDPNAGGTYAVRPTKAFAFIENADDFPGSATRWHFK